MYLLTLRSITLTEYPYVRTQSAVWGKYILDIPASETFLFYGELLVVRVCSPCCLASPKIHWFHSTVWFYLYHIMNLASYRPLFWKWLDTRLKICLNLHDQLFDNDISSGKRLAYWTDEVGVSHFPSSLEQTNIPKYLNCCNSTISRVWSF